MTISTQDVVTAGSHETRLEQRVVRPRALAWMTWRRRLVEWAVGLVLWGGVLMIASPLGQLLSAMWDTVQEMWRTR